MYKYEQMIGDSEHTWGDVIKFLDGFIANALDGKINETRTSTYFANVATAVGARVELSERMDKSSAPPAKYRQ